MDVVVQVTYMVSRSRWKQHASHRLSVFATSLRDWTRAFYEQTKARRRAAALSKAVVKSSCNGETNQNNQFERMTTTGYGRSFSVHLFARAPLLRPFIMPPQ
jgi:hypothetical protein